MREYYEVLGLEETYDLKTVKHGYANMVKVFNPEKHPEEFAKIRDAYEEIIKYIKDNQRDKEKSELLLKEQQDNSVVLHRKYIKKLDELFEKKEYDKMIFLYEKHIETYEDLLKCSDKVGILNMIGIAYMKKEKFSIAINKFEKAIKIDNTREISYSNLANACKKIKDYKNSAINYGKAYELNNKNNKYKQQIFESNILSYDSKELFANMKKYKLSEEEKLHYFIICLNQYIKIYKNKDKENVGHIYDISNIIAEEYKNNPYKMDMYRQVSKLVDELNEQEYYDLAKIISTTIIEFLDENTKRKSNKNKKWWWHSWR